jgi:hypothetical protein
MRILHPDLIQEYYNSIKDQYPDLTKEQCNEICSAPFIEVRKGIESGTFVNIRLQFFGTFVSYPKKLNYFLEVYSKMFKEQRISPVNYFRKKQLLEAAIKRKEKENESKNNF